MPLDKQQVKVLVSAVADTREDEINCDECLAGMAEFAERQLVGAEIREALKQIQAHIDFCPECAEEYEALLEAVSAASSNPID